MDVQHFPQKWGGFYLHHQKKVFSCWLQWGHNFILWKVSQLGLKGSWITYPLHRKKAHKGSATSDDKNVQFLPQKILFGLNLCKYINITKKGVLTMTKKQKENQPENQWNKEDIPGLKSDP